MHMSARMSIHLSMHISIHTCPCACPYACPYACSYTGHLFEALDGSMDSLGVTGYGISLPTMQEVFLRILDKEAKAGGYKAGSADDKEHDRELLISPVDNVAHETGATPSLGYQLKVESVGPIRGTAPSPSNLPWGNPSNVPSNASSNVLCRQCCSRDGGCS